jgi:ketosteroid isomerase-like protein
VPWHHQYNPARRLRPLPATGKSATAPIAEIFRIADGQIVKVWVYPDTPSIMQQFGLIPTSDGA